MKAFLEEVAEDLFSRYAGEMESLCLVFPNRRAGLFFNKYLSSMLDQPVWSPAIFTIQDLMSHISELEMADELELISTLYSVYSEIRGGQESFDDFFFWGEVMLNDFDEIDKYLVDATDIFRNIADLKEIEQSFDYLSEEQLKLIKRFWGSFDPDALSEQKHMFLEIWNILSPVYKGLRSRLLESGTGYEGMIFRNVAEAISEGNSPELDFSKVVFIGFNALNNCEKKLFSTLRNTAKALFYWDYDHHYIENDIHEAGRFIRENLTDYPDAGTAFRHDNLKSREKDFRAYSVPSDGGQAQIVHRILEEASLEKELGEETAIVLADEELLIPVLNALPEELKEINVTMGYPVSATPVFSLIEHLLSLQRNIKDGKGVRFYYADVLPVIQHQYISLRQAADSGEIVNAVHARNRIYLPAKDLKKNELFSLIFSKVERAEEIPAYLLSILEMITGGGSGEDKPVPAIELEFIYRIYTRIKRLKDILGRLNLSFNLQTFLRLYHRFLQRTSIPFSGEPLAGVQVMGVLETRVLDFERVILLSMNEGAFPKSSAAGSFIPHNLRLGFKMPTLEFQDAIYAYYFYRLVQRSNDIHLLFNNRAEGMSTGERSRYLYQLRYEPDLKLSEYPVGFDVQASGMGEILARKTEEIMGILKEYTTGGGDRYFSPSALNTYIDCPLRFYYNYIAGIREPDEMQEEVDPALFGTLLHESVRMIYSELKNPVEKDDLEAILKKPDHIREYINRVFALEWTGEPDSPPEGRNKVIREIIYTYVVRILQKDQEYCPLHLFSLEDSYYLELPLEGGSMVRLGGKIDRIDRLGDTYRVLDYKTGSGKMVFGSMEELFQGELNTRNRAAFQTLLYARLFSEKHADLPVIPGIYMIRDIFSENFRYHFGIGTDKRHEPLLDYAKVNEDFNSMLRGLLEEIFNPQLPFTQTSKEEICRICPYREICHR